MRTAVVILNWNTREYLRAFVPALLESLGADDSLIVADSASTDGSLEMLTSEFPQVKTIPLDANYGFTGGYNRALSGLEAEYYVLINSDVLVSKDWLEPLVAWMESHPGCGVCGPKLHGLKADSSADSSTAYIKTGRFEYAGAAGGYLDRWGFPFCRGRVLGRVCEDSGQYDSPADVLWCTGACMMVRSSVWKALGGLDPRFFAHMEEIDFCWRAQLAGWKVTVVPQSLVWHLGGGTLAPKSPWKLELNYRNNLLLLQNNLKRTYMAEGLPAEKASRKAGVKIWMRMVIDGLSFVAYTLSGKWSYASAVVKAHRGFRSLRGEPGAASPASSSPAVPEGLTGIGIIPAALLWGGRIFNYLDKKVFNI